MLYPSEEAGLFTGLGCTRDSDFVIVALAKAYMVVFAMIPTSILT
jgi:hypothetical protein